MWVWFSHAYIHENTAICDFLPHSYVCFCFHLLLGFFFVLANYDIVTELNFYVHVFQDRKCCSKRPLCKKSWTTLQHFLFLSWRHFCLRKTVSNSSGRYGSDFAVPFRVPRRSCVCAERHRHLTLSLAPLRERFGVFSSWGSALGEHLSLCDKAAFWKTFQGFICFAKCFNCLWSVCNFCFQQRWLNVSHFKQRISRLVGEAGLVEGLVKALGTRTGVTPIKLTSLLWKQAHPDVVLHDSVCDERCHKALCCGKLVDNTEIRRYVLLSSVCLNI